MTHGADLLPPFLAALGAVTLTYVALRAPVIRQENAAGDPAQRFAPVPPPLLRDGGATPVLTRADRSALPETPGPWVRIDDTLLVDVQEEMSRA